MTTLHTPGPWKIHWGAAQGGEGHVIVDSNDIGELSIVAIASFHDDKDGETKANAHLIAEAPEMLDTLRWIATECETLGHAKAEARALIAKIEGAA